MSVKLGVCLPNDLAARVDEEARKNRISRSALITRVLLHYIPGDGAPPLDAAAVQAKVRCAQCDQLVQPEWIGRPHRVGRTACPGGPAA